MRGLDREGKGGIGFDFGQGIQGGISGYGAGSLGAGAKNLFTGAMARRATEKTLSSLAPTDMASKIGMTPGTITASATPASAVNFAAPSAPSATSLVAGRPVASQEVAQSVADFARAPKPIETRVTQSVADAARTTKPTPFYKTKEGLEFIGKGMTAGSNILGQQATAAQAEREYEDQQRQLQNRAELMALFAPQMAGNLGMQLGGGAPMGSFSQFADNAAMLATDDPRIRYLEDYRARTNPVYGNTRTAPMTGAEYMATGFGGSDRARQVAEEAAARGRAYTYGRR
jgi:hypothetical protein